MPSLLLLAPLALELECAPTLGYSSERQVKGNHEIWRNSDTRRYVTVPNHPGTLPPGTLRAIIRQAGLSVEEFMELD